MRFKASYSNGNLSVGSPMEFTRFSGKTVSQFSEYMNFMSVATANELTIFDNDNDSVIFTKENDNSWSHGLHALKMGSILADSNDKKHFKLAYYSKKLGESLSVYNEVHVFTNWEDKSKMTAFEMKNLHSANSNEYENATCFTTVGTNLIFNENSNFKTFMSGGFDSKVLGDLNVGGDDVDYKDANTCKITVKSALSDLNFQETTTLKADQFFTCTEKTELYGCKIQYNKSTTAEDWADYTVTGT